MRLHYILSDQITIQVHLEGEAQMAHQKKPTPALIAQACEAIKQGATIELAAGAIGISRRTWYRWMQRGEDGEKPYSRFYSAVRQAEGESAMAALEHINQASAGDWKAAAWLLERRHGYTREQHSREKLEEAQHSEAGPGSTIEDFSSPEGLAALAGDLKTIGPRLLCEVIHSDDHARQLIEAALEAVKHRQKPSHSAR